MNTYQTIVEKSKTIDWINSDISSSLNIEFSVPKTHPRSIFLSKYNIVLNKFSEYHPEETTLILCDNSIKSLLSKQTGFLSSCYFLEPVENVLKMIPTADKFISNLNGNYKKVIVVGGGIISNFGGYIAEKLNTDLVYIPTTIIAMSDACIGGKVRMNNIQDGEYIKHAYKTFYEPSEVIIDPIFLNSFNDEQVRIGLAEVIKHAVYQSSLLADYLLSDLFDPFKNKESLLRAILWTADLKRICLELDPEESKDGSYKILRAAHDISDRLEEVSGFTLSHGKAVEKAMTEDLYLDKEKYTLLLNIYNKLGIEYAGL